MTNEHRAAVRRVLTLVVVPALFLSIMTANAFATRGRVFAGTFGGASSTKSDPYPLSNTDGCADASGTCQKRIAVDATTERASSGDVYVADPNNRRIEKFDGTGNFILMFGKNVNKTKVEEAGSTEAERNVCTAVSGDVCQQGTEGTSPGAFVGKGLAVAVDNSSGPSSEDVYVDNTTKNPNPATKGEGAGEATITKFTPTGEVVASWGVDGQMDGAGQSFGALGGITVDSSGNLWVAGTTEAEEFANGIKNYRPRPLIFELNAGGSLITSWQPSRKLEQSEHGIAVDAEHHVYLVVGRAEQDIAQLEASDGEFISEYPEGGEFIASDLAAHAIDALQLNKKILVLETSCPDGFGSCLPTETVTRSAPHSWGPLAVNYSIPSNTIYVEEEQREVAMEEIATVPDVTSLPATVASTSSATLNGAVNPEGVPITECYFQWGEGEGEYEHAVPCAHPSAAEIPAGNSFEDVQAQIAIQAGKAYHYRLVAANAVDEAEPVEGADIELGPPRIDNDSATQVTTSSATLAAEIDPRNLVTSYHFEYLTEAAFEADGESFSGPAPATSVPLVPSELVAGQKTVSVSVHVGGLEAHTTYRYRVVAENLLGEGADASRGTPEPLLTWGTGGFSLLDGRGWELVSPPDKHGALVEPIGEDWIIQAAAEGGRLAYSTRAPSESNPSGYLIYQSSLATRTSGGWTSHNLALPHVTATGFSVGQGWEYRIFSEDLSHAIVQPFGAFVSCSSALGDAQPCLSPQATEQTPFLASNYKEARSGETCSESCYTPLVTGAEGVADVPPETEFGQLSVEGGECPPQLFCGPRFLDATPDLDHVLLEAPVALGPSPSPKATVPPKSLYEWSAEAPPSEELRLVSVLPGNSSKEARPAPVPTIGYSQDGARHAISNDGSRVVFTAGGEQESEQHLYLRDHATAPSSPIGPGGECLVATDACTVQLDAGLPGRVVQFQTANSAVTRVFFTESLGELGKEADLYEYNLEKGERVRITTGADVLASIIGASEDGTMLYFVGDGALTAHAVTNGTCKPITIRETVKAGPGCNLYAMHYDGGHWEAPILIAVLSNEDIPDWSGDSSAYTGLTARVSPNGQWLAFVSTHRLTGYDNEDVVSDEPDSEVYEYDAATGDLVCASCNPTGARPYGRSSVQINTANGGIAGGHEVYREGWFAATLPPWTPSLTSSDSIYQSRYLSDSGRLFFNADDALVPKDTNGTEDVYEYEPEGVPAGEHACSPGSESGGITYKPAHRLQVDGGEVHEGPGCIGLISSGESAQESAFLDATESGSEVFFITTARLSARDTDTAYDVYDARECTTTSPCAPEPAATPQPCEEEASCKPTPSSSPPIFALSGSATFSGPGNLVQPLTAAASKPKPKPKPLTKAQLLARALKACRKDKIRRKRTACEKQARKRYGAKKASRHKSAQRGRTK